MEPFTYKHSTKGSTRVFGIHREAVDTLWVKPVRAIARQHGVELAFGLLPGKGVKGNWFEIPASRQGTARGFESRFIAALEAAGLWHNGVPCLPYADGTDNPLQIGAERDSDGRLPVLCGGAAIGAIDDSDTPVFLPLDGIRLGTLELEPLAAALSEMEFPADAEWDWKQALAERENTARA